MNPLIALRKENERSKRFIANKINVPYATYRLLEEITTIADLKKHLKVETLENILSYFQISYDEFFEKFNKAGDV